MPEIVIQGLASILLIIFWQKRNPENVWIHAIYFISIIIVMSFFI